VKKLLLFLIISSVGVLWFGSLQGCGPSQEEQRAAESRGAARSTAVWREELVANEKERYQIHDHNGNLIKLDTSTGRTWLLIGSDWCELHDNLSPAPALPDFTSQSLTNKP
jgi:hypothetical protein